MNQLKEKAIYLLLVIGRFGLNFIYCFHKLCPVSNRISIVSRQSETPYLDLRLLETELKNCDPDTEVVVSCRMVGEGLRGKLSYVLHLITVQMHLFATSKAVVLDTYCISASMLKHKKNLKIIQMWHAMGAFKRFGYSSIGETEGRSAVLAEGMRMHRNYDAVFISSEACREPMAASFGCDPEKLVVMPLPRTDFITDPMITERTAEKIRSRYPQLQGRRVILYAPTFRKNGKILPYAKMLIDAVDYDSYALAVKLHPLDRERIIAKHALIDAEFTSQEWLSVSDAVITDYSAFIYEAAAAGKQIYRYVPDDAEYDAGRGFLVDPDAEFPFYKSDDAGEIIRAVQDVRCDPKAVKRFAAKYVKPGENNTKNMAQYILKTAYAETER